VTLRETFGNFTQTMERLKAKYKLHSEELNTMDIDMPNFFSIM